jgi:hypothetical protein
MKQHHHRHGSNNNNQHYSYSVASAVHRRRHVFLYHPSSSSFPFVVYLFGFLTTVSWFIGITLFLESTTRDLAIPLSVQQQQQQNKSVASPALTIMPSSRWASRNQDVGGIAASSDADAVGASGDGDIPLYNFTVAICLVVSDGEQYFQEWVDYHLLAMQFEAIYVYDNSDNFDLCRWHDNTRHHPVYSRVHVQHRPGPGYLEKEGRYLQLEVYKDCIQKYGKDANGPQHDYL